MNKIAVLIPAILLFSIISCSTDKQTEPSTSDTVYLADIDKDYSGIKVVYYENGQKKAETTYCNGKIDGSDVIWTKDGQKKAETNYSKGEKNDIYVSWYNNGAKKTEGKFKEGKRAGRWTWWNEKGEVTYELCYGGC